MTRIHTKRWLLSRRHVLRGLGAAIALPLLDCMVPGRAPAKRPKRSVFVYFPNGANMLTWQIREAGADYELPAPLASLARHRRDLTPISGLHHPAGIGVNHRCGEIFLTGADLGERGRNTISADQLMAEALQTETRYRSLELAVTGGTLAFSREGVALPAERSPRAVFERLFVAPSGGTAATRRRLQRRGSVLDAVLDRAAALRRGIGAGDRTRLDEYLAAVRDVERRTTAAQGWLEVPRPEVGDRAAARFAREIPRTAAGDWYRTVYDLIVLALRTDQTRVVTFVTGSESLGLSIPEIGVRQTRHELSHHGGNPVKMQRLTRCDGFLTGCFAHLLDGLGAVREQGESLLDRTMVLYGSGMSYGHNHGNANLPLILAGGRSLGLAHGRHLDFNLPVIRRYPLERPQDYYRLCLRPADQGARLNSLLLTMLQRMGVAVTSFGDSRGGISGILV